MLKILKKPLVKRRSLKFDKIKKNLLDEKQKLEEQLKKLSDLNSDDDSDSFGRNEDVDPDTAADEFEEIGNNLAMYQVLEKELEKVNEALEKIKNGSYGQCESCHKGIRVMKLKISPSARYCTKCIKEMEGR